MSRQHGARAAVFNTGYPRAFFFAACVHLRSLQVLAAAAASSGRRVCLLLAASFLNSHGGCG